MKPLPENPKGFWEHTGLTGINDEILATLGGSWHEPPVFPADWGWSKQFSELRQQRGD